MKLLLKLAWRNIWRNKRRSFITIAAIVFAIVLSVVQRGMQLGTYQTNIHTSVRLSSGFLQIQKPGYQKNPSLRKSFIFSDSLQSRLESIPEITGYSPRIYANGLVSFGNSSQGAMLWGLDPLREPQITDFHEKIDSGRFLRPGEETEIVVGHRLLDNLQAAVGDSVVILAQGFDGILGNMFFRIVGTLKTGAGEMDRQAILMNLSGARELLGMYGRSSVVAISLERLKDIPEVKSRLSEYLPDNLAVLSWEEIMPELKQSIELDNISGILFMVILFVVVAFGILNTILMAVTERFREFGILLSLGMPEHKLVQTVFWESLFIIFLGLVAGNLLGALANYYFVQNPIILSGGYAELIISEYGWLPRIDSAMEPGIYLYTTLSVLAISLLACIYPLIKVYRLEPLKGIRYT